MNEDSTEFIACGHLTDDWNKVFFDSLNGGMEFGPGSFLGMGSPFNLMDHFSVHRYYQAGGDTDFTDEQYYKIFARAQKVGGDIDRAAETISEYVPEGEIGIIVDEWGVWHPEARSDNGLEQENTVRDALTTAGVLDLIHARADVVSMANIAQLVNVLQCLVQTDEEAAWRTPTYRVFDLYENHIGQTALETSVDTEKRAIEGEDHDVPMVSASASEGDGELFVTASNRRHDEPETAHRRRRVVVVLGVHGHRPVRGQRHPRVLHEGERGLVRSQPSGRHRRGRRNYHVRSAAGVRRRPDADGVTEPPSFFFELTAGIQLLWCRVNI